MEKLEKLSIICLMLGIVAFVFGWFQMFMTDNSILEAVRKYTFMIGGILLMILSYSLNLIKDVISKKLS